MALTGVREKFVEFLPYTPGLMLLSRQRISTGLSTLRCVPMSPVVHMPVSVLAFYKCGRQTMVEGVPLPAYAEVLHL